MEQVQERNQSVSSVARDRVLLFARVSQVLSLFSSIVIMLFVQSVTYNLADPDDGSCEACNNETCCLTLKSTLNLNQDRCYWDLSASSINSTLVNGSCHFRDIGEDMTRMFIVTFFSTIVSAPLALGVQHLIVNILSKETMKDRDGEKAKEKQKVNRRGMKRGLPLFSKGRTAASDLVETCGSSVQDDRNNLLRELPVCYQYLLRNDQSKAKAFLGKCFHWVSCSHLSRLVGIATWR